MGEDVSASASGDGSGAIGSNQNERPEAPNEAAGASRGTPAAEVPPEVGSRSQIGNYRIDRKLGGGVMTVVYRAMDTVLDRLVALKVLLQGADDTTRERFRREARTAAMLEHPNIVRTYQVGEQPSTGLSYIAMELVHGPSLAQLLEQVQVLTPADAAALLEPIARALAYAHERGVVHRDVKPSNILFQTVDAGHPLGVDVSVGPGKLAPLLSDFGIARALDAPDLTSAGRTIGTPAFMAPEQCLGADEIDGRADVYSLGAVVYRCLVGKPPFAGSTTQILHAHVYEQLTIPADAFHALPPLAVDIIRRSMAKDPDDRYTSATEMAQDLARLTSDSADVVAGTKQIDKNETMEMPSGMRIPGSAGASSYVLVPARKVSTASEEAIEARSPETGSGAPKTGTAISEAESERPRPVAQAATGRARRPDMSRLGMVVLAAALVALVVMLGLTVYSGILPAMDTREQGTPAPTEVNRADAKTPGAAAGADQTDRDGTTQGESSQPAAAVTSVAGSTDGSADPAATTTPNADSLQVSPTFAWRNARELFAEQDLTGARDWLIAVRRADPELEAEAVSAMLAETDARLALLALQNENYTSAVDLLQEAAAVSGESGPYPDLYESVSRLVGADASDVEAELAAVQLAIVPFAELLAADERSCDALQQIEVADSLLPSPGMQDMLDTYTSLCDEEFAASNLPPISGTILFSAVDGEGYGLFIFPAGTNSAPRRILGEASQPAVSPDRSTIAYYSRRNGMTGLTSSPINAGWDITDDRFRLSGYAEDAHDSAPSWNPQSDRLVYASTAFGDGRSRLYLAWANGSGEPVELGLGKDPAWHPYEDRIVFNGTDQAGSNPGLWMMRTDGTGRVQLTDNGNDQRPAWLPDGSGIVFMSSGRDGNWELYLLDLASGSIIRLTENPAQDGLPAVSPDGAYIAFMSDRDGYWSMWYVPTSGGTAERLEQFAQEMPQWLEHSVQWLAAN